MNINSNINAHLKVGYNSKIAELPEVKTNKVLQIHLLATYKDGGTQKFSCLSGEFKGQTIYKDVAIGSKTRGQYFLGSPNILNGKQLTGYTFVQV